MERSSPLLLRTRHGRYEEDTELRGGTLNWTEALLSTGNTGMLPMDSFFGWMFQAGGLSSASATAVF